MENSATGLKPAILCLIANREAILVQDKTVMRTMIVVLNVETEFVKLFLNIVVPVHKTVRVTVSKENAVAMEYVRSLKKEKAPARQIADKTM